MVGARMERATESDARPSPCGGRVSHQMGPTRSDLHCVVFISFHFAFPHLYLSTPIHPYPLPTPTRPILMRLLSSPILAFGRSFPLFPSPPSRIHSLHCSSPRLRPLLPPSFLVSLLHSAPFTSRSVAPSHPVPHPVSLLTSVPFGYPLACTSIIPTTPPFASPLTRILICTLSTFHSPLSHRVLVIQLLVARGSPQSPAFPPHLVLYSLPTSSSLDTFPSSLRAPSACPHRFLRLPASHPSSSAIFLSDSYLLPPSSSPFLPAQ
ncbi:hypothetical protein B0H15DRAFT_852229 [Mycena belliarum]|uniref:Uncharacterized protein n=1 Tax=Mycena belliarum TaxID=1033014 RepID=A0AAD6XNQ9_9AGAR|nr:hypothetical protein B0H15DRAFT_852229 [Mycena belliae]